MLLSAEEWRKDKKVDELARCVIFSFFFSLLYNDILFCVLVGRFPVVS